MRHSKDITGLPILGIQEGRKCGQVKGFLINPAEGKTEYLLIDNGAWHQGASVLPYGEVYALGTDAVTILTADSIRPIQDLPEAMALAAQDVALLGAQVYTDAGRFAGVLAEFSLSPQNGGITSCIVESAQGTFLVSAANIRTIGKDLIIIRELDYPSDPADDSEDPFDDHALDLPQALADFGAEDEWHDPAPLAAEQEGLSSVPEALDLPAPAEAQEIEASQETEGDTAEAAEAPTQAEEEADVEDTESVAPSGGEDLEEDGAETAPAQDGAEADSAALLFEQRQRRFLVGRKASKSILDDEGRLLVKVNQEITDEVFDQVKAHGRLIELTMNSKP